jgi:metal-sulfur cluster biosynthetic enzyme
MNEQEVTVGEEVVTHEGDTPVAPMTEARSPGPDAAARANGGDAAGKEAVLEALRNVYDPELGINVVDLGLVYEVEIAPDGGVDITYSLTTMGCPIGPLIEQQMQQFVSQVPGVTDVRSEMVLRPAWSPEMMSDEAKAALGIF